MSNTSPHKKMRVDAWVKPVVAITYKANNAQAIIPFGIKDIRHPIDPDKDIVIKELQDGQ
jgi:hypothetical protein